MDGAWPLQIAALIHHVLKLEFPPSLNKEISSIEAMDRSGKSGSIRWRRQRFQDFYCSYYRIPPKRFVGRFLAQALYPQARLFYFFVRPFMPKIDRGDRELVSDIGACTSLESVRNVLGRLPHYYAKWGFLRKRVKIRISSQRVLAKISSFPRDY